MKDETYKMLQEEFEYVQPEERSYLNSELNKYISKELPKVFTCINVDALLHKNINGTEIKRFIEYKHLFEKLGKQQENTLRSLAKDLSKVNDESSINGVYIVRGNFPFELVEITHLNDVSERDYSVVIDNNEFKKWLKFEILGIRSLTRISDEDKYREFLTEKHKRYYEYSNERDRRTLCEINKNLKED
jgi:hypothetical protein